MGEYDYITWVVLNDNRWPSERVSNDERKRKINGLAQRYKLCNKIASHQTKRLRKDWEYNDNNHSIRV